MNKSNNNNRESGHSWLDAAAIEAQLRSARPDPVQVREILDQALTLEGLAPDEVAALMQVESPELLDELFNTAKRVKETICGEE
jgi:2-iminoacetate synthase